MNFFDFNNDWIITLEKNKRKIHQAKVNDKIATYENNLGAYRYHVAPYFFLFDEKHFNELSCAIEHIMEAQRKIVKRICKIKKHEEILEYFNLPTDMKDLIDWQELQDGQYTFGRFDVLPHKYGYKFCEFNVHAAVGGIDMFDCYSIFRSKLQLPNIVERYSPFIDMASVVGKILKNGSYKRIVLLDWSTHSKAGYPHISYMKSYIEEICNDIPIIYCTEESYDASWLDPDEGKKTLVLRAFTYGDTNDRGLFIKKLKKSQATLFSDFESEIKMNKKWFAIFWEKEYQSILNDDERNTIKKYIPYTTVLDCHNFERIMNKKDKYIFKITNSYGGDNVFLGKDYSKKEILKKLTEKKLSNWVCQKVVDLPDLVASHDESGDPELHKVVLGIYVSSNQSNGVFLSMRKNIDFGKPISGSARMGWALVVNQDQKNQLISTLNTTKG